MAAAHIGFESGGTDDVRSKMMIRRTFIHIVDDSTEFASHVRRTSSMPALGLTVQKLNGTFNAPSPLCHQQLDCSARTECALRARIPPCSTNVLEPAFASKHADKRIECSAQVPELAVSLANKDSSKQPDSPIFEQDVANGSKDGVHVSVVNTDDKQITPPPQAGRDLSTVDLSEARMAKSDTQKDASQAKTTSSGSMDIAGTCSAHGDGVHCRQVKNEVEVVSSWEEGVSLETRSSVAARLRGATTIMVQNVPPAFFQDSFAFFVDELGFADKYDLLYMPWCFQSRTGKGYAFVNFLTANIAVEFALACKTLRIRFSRAALQGRAAYMEGGAQRRRRRIRNSQYKPFIREGPIETHNLRTT